jgi:origin recognition complex subunit 2
MEEWFQNASSEECDAMLALQLDYRFEGDQFATHWWMLFRQLGFEHTGTIYQMPKSFPTTPGKSYTATQMYQLMDTFAIPQLVSSFQREEIIKTSEPKMIMTDDEAKWWKELRAKLIFRRFYSDVEVRTTDQQQQESRGPSRKIPKRQSKSNPRATDAISIRNKRKSSSADSGAELYLRKTSKRIRHVKRKNNVVDIDHDDFAFPTIQEYTKAARKYNIEDLDTMENSYYDSFKEWRFLAATNQSLLFYGVGSKRSLLNTFVEKELKKDGDVLVINGYDKEVSIEALLQLIVHNWLGGVDPKNDIDDVHLHRGRISGGIAYPRHGNPLVVQKAIAIGQALVGLVTESLRPLYLVIHNIDGIGLRNYTAQEALAGLVFHSKTHVNGQNALRLVTSIDHVNGPLLLWDSMSCASFRWTWKQVHTYRPYIEEITESKIPDVQPKTVKRKGATVSTSTEQIDGVIKESTFQVLESLAPRITQSLHELVKLQLNKRNKWVDYKEIFKRCQMEFIINTDATLRKYLKELKDHNIVESNHHKYRVPFNNEGLKKILKFKR